MVVVRQGSVLNTTITLTATAGSKADVATESAEDTVKTEVHSGIDAPELEGLPCLDIVEREERNGAVVFQYALRLLPGEPAVSFESAEIKNRQRTIGTILDDVASIWKNTDGEPEEREQKLQDIGSKLFDELFPVPMQAYLWKHRAKLKDLIVYADEPFVPWELVHLKPPDGPRPAEAPVPRPERPRALAPQQLPAAADPGAQGAREVAVPGVPRPAVRAHRTRPRAAVPRGPVRGQPGHRHPDAVSRTLLRSGGFDLLHFSGHGAASAGKILDAKLLLQGRKRGGTVEPQYFGATTVSENAKPAGKNGVGPVVVLNACQVGQAGELLTTVGGFAKAFLDAGASAFVSCLWSVHQEPSRIFVEKLYDELLDGTPIGDRQRPRTRSDPQGRRRDLARLRRLLPARRSTRQVLTGCPNHQHQKHHDKEGSTPWLATHCVSGSTSSSHCREQLAERLRQRRQRHLQALKKMGFPRATCR